MSRTGYLDPRLSHREIYGADVVDNTSPIWGLDDEGEIRGVYRPTGHPGVRRILHPMKLGLLKSCDSYGMPAGTLHRLASCQNN